LIPAGSFCTVRHDIMIGPDMAFMAGETVRVEGTSPNPGRPEYRYIITSSKMGQKFQLRDEDLLVKTNAPTPETMPPGPVPPVKRKASVGKWIALGVAGLIAIAVAVVGISAAVNKIDKMNSEAAKSTTPARAEGTFQTVYTKDGNSNFRSGTIHLGRGENILSYSVTGATSEGLPKLPVWAIYVMQNGTSLDKDGGIPEVTMTQSGPGQTHLIQNEGNYYLDIKSANCVWSVTIQEKL
jgi:hypothetical protein